MAVQVLVCSWLVWLRFPVTPSIFLRACMRQYRILMGTARGLMFLNWLKTVFCGHEMCWILKGIWETGWKASGRNQCRVSAPFVYTRWSLQQLCWSSYPSWKEFFIPILMKHIWWFLLQVCQALQLIGHWLLGDFGKCMFWHSCFKFPNAAVPVTAHDEIMSPVNYLQRQGCVGRGALIVKWKLPKAMKQ